MSHHVIEVDEAKVQFEHTEHFRDPQAFWIVATQKADFKVSIKGIRCYGDSPDNLVRKPRDCKSSQSN